MSLKFIEILQEEKNQCKYQIRNIGGSDVYYKKCGKGNWLFIDELEFIKNSKKSNIVGWEKPKEKKSKINQLDVPKKRGDKLDNLKIYYTNLSPDLYDVSINNETIIIKPIPQQYQ
jgi:hypothetical protein